MGYHRAGDRASAEKVYRQLLREDGRDTVVLHLLGALLLETERNKEGLEILRRAVGVAPTQAVLFANLGEAQRRLGDHEGARASLHRAIALQPDLAEAHYTLGLTLRAQGDGEAALAFESAVALKPTLLPAYVGLAGAHYDAGLLEAARDACLRALAIDGQFAEAHHQLGIVLKDLGHIDEAVASYRRALACRPDYPVAHSSLVYALAFHPGEDSRSIAREAVRWREQYAVAASRDRRPHTSDRDPERKLRVGYVSPDFRDHCQALFFLPLLERHDRQAVEVYCYSHVARPDAVTARIERLADRFRDIGGLRDADAVEVIRADAVDVLVDLTMHMAKGRLLLFAARPAPVQVTWLAYPGTTGLDSIDYRITDPHLDPPGVDVEGLYAEASVRLPHSFWCYDPLAREPPVNPLPALQEGRVTFGCLNSYGKTNDEVFALWARVLASVEGSRMVVLAQPGEPRTRARAAFARAGVDPERLAFVGYQPRSAYLAEYHRIDLALDTFPYGGHTTSLDAFWMGVPVVTLLGRTVVGRAGLCYAHHLGMPEIVATTPDQYVAVAAGLARDVARLADLRSGLRERMERSPLMDAPRFARHLEAAYREMWRRWCAHG
jgi:predicted O-linked N-acetylglucosamine transferase (SPINDLY family)